jgi:outer membrane protein OmpA-like peptidoglycan-associated protein
VLKGNGIDYHCADNFSFPPHGFYPVQPVGDSVNQGIKLLKELFDANPSLKLKLTGYYMPSEKNDTKFTNLGFARAEEIKNYFVSKGIPASRIETTPDIKDSLVIRNHFVFGPASYQLVESENKPEALTIYFQTAQAQTTLSSGEIQRMQEMVTFLGKVPGAKIRITGHTDITGTRETNMKLGQARADFAKSWMVKEGAGENRLEVSTKGPDDPAADNSTTEGKAKNRRTEIKVI